MSACDAKLTQLFDLVLTLTLFHDLENLASSFGMCYFVKTRKTVQKTGGPKFNTFDSVTPFLL